jgi:hypothetical protein
VIIRTAHVTFGNFAGHLCPTEGPDHYAYRLPFCRRIAVIEVEHYEVGLATVDTRMRAQVFHHAVEICLVVSGVVAAGPCDVRRLITLIVAAISPFVAFAAEVMQPATSFVFEAELTEWLDLAARASAFLTPLSIHATL